MTQAWKSQKKLFIPSNIEDQKYKLKINKIQIKLIQNSLKLDYLASLCSNSLNVLEFQEFDWQKYICKYILFMLLYRAKSYPVQGFRGFDEELNTHHFRNPGSYANPFNKVRRNIPHELNHHKAKFSKERLLNRLSLQSKKEQQYEKSISHNKYTINLAKNLSYNSLPQILTLAKAHQALISEDAFQHYKRMNAVNGRYQEGLIELEKEESKKMYKLRLPDNVKIKTRKNVNQDQKTQKLLKNQDCAAFLGRKQKQTKNQISRLRKSCLNIDCTANKRKKPIFCEDRKWNLRDFLDPIICDQSQCKEDLQRLKQKLSFLSQVSRVNKSCQVMQCQMKTENYLRLFGKFSQNISSKLERKTKKLEKIQKIFSECVSLN